MNLFRSITAFFLLIFGVVAQSYATTQPLLNGWRPQWGGATYYPDVPSVCAFELGLWATSPDWTAACVNISQNDATGEGSYSIRATVNGPSSVFTDANRVSSRSDYCPTGFTILNGVCNDNPLADSPCPDAGTQHSSGLYDFGTNPNNPQDGLIVGCDPANSCETVVGEFDNISQRGKVDGVYHYYAEGYIVYSGSTCVAGVADVIGTSDPNAPQTCAAGQIAILSVSGVMNCYEDSGVGDGSSVPYSGTSGGAGGGDGASTEETETSTTTTTNADGTTTTTTSSTTKTSSSDTKRADGTQASELPVEIADATTLYDGKLNNDKTLDVVMGDFKGRVLGSDAGFAAGNFFTVNVAGGACPSWSTTVPMFTEPFTFDFYCASWFQDLLPWIRSLIMLIFSVVAFRIAIL